MSANLKPKEIKKTKKELREEKKKEKIQEFSLKLVNTRKKFLKEENYLAKNFSTIYADEIIGKKKIIEELSIKMKRFARALKRLGVAIDLDQIRVQG